MTVPLKYAHVERERRFLVTELPAGVVGTKLISDRYIVGTRMRLREVTENGRRDEEAVSQGAAQ